MLVDEMEAGRELDALAAVEVEGYVWVRGDADVPRAHLRMPDNAKGMRRAEPDDERLYESAWGYSTNDAYAFRLADKCIEMSGDMFSLNRYTENGMWEATVYLPLMTGTLYAKGEAKTRPHAVTIAAVKAARLLKGCALAPRAGRVAVESTGEV